jgi:CMP-N,N'-diacetyllegionaminic acid synthase
VTKNIGKNRIVCLIPARNGSKRIKNKNLKKVNSKPLIYYACNAANIVEIYKIYLATSSTKIIEKSKNYKNIKIFYRTKNSEKDKASTENLIKEFIKTNSNFDIMILLQCTNIFITKKCLKKAIKKFLKKKFDSMLSVVKSNHFLWELKKKGIVKPLNYNPKKRPRSQSLKHNFIENGSFYIFKKKGFLKNNCRLFGKIGHYVMSKESIHEIDTHEDLKIIKKLKIVKKYKN